MKATTEFVTRVTSEGSFIKVILNHDHNVYPQEYKGINFFIHRDHWAGLWNAIESKTGSSIVVGYYTKKECFKYALLYIDNTIDIDKMIQHQINLTRSAKTIYMDEYIAIEGQNNETNKSR